MTATPAERPGSLDRLDVLTGERDMEGAFDAGLSKLSAAVLAGPVTRVGRRSRHGYDVSARGGLAGRLHSR